MRAPLAHSHTRKKRKRGTEATVLFFLLLFYSYGANAKERRKKDRARVLLLAGFWTGITEHAQRSRHWGGAVDAKARAHGGQAKAKAKARRGEKNPIARPARHRAAGNAAPDFFPFPLCVLISGMDSRQRETQRSHCSQDEVAGASQPVQEEKNKCLAVSTEQGCDGGFRSFCLFPPLQRWLCMLGLTVSLL